MVAGSSVVAPIGRHSRDRVRMAVVEGGRPAITHYRVHQRYRAHTALECRLETGRSEEHTSELQSLMRNSYAVFCLKKKTEHPHYHICQLHSQSNYNHKHPTSNHI